MENNIYRFVEAQEKSYEGYETALREMSNGRKQSHWIWYIFPQIRGLGRSWASNYYGIADQKEAAEYLEHPILGKRLREITQIVLDSPEMNAHTLMGSGIDVSKLQSCMTLFAETAPEMEVFVKVLDKYFSGKKDQNTLRILREKTE